MNMPMQSKLTNSLFKHFYVFLTDILAGYVSLTADNFLFLGYICCLSKYKVGSEHPDTDGKGMREKRFTLSGASSVSDFSD